MLHSYSNRNEFPEPAKAASFGQWCGWVGKNRLIILAPNQQYHLLS